MRLDRFTDTTLDVAGRYVVVRNVAKYFAIIKDKRAEMGARDLEITSKVEVMSGLALTDQIVVNPGDSLEDGQQVKVKTGGGT